MLQLVDGRTVPGAPHGTESKPIPASLKYVHGASSQPKGCGDQLFNDLYHAVEVDLLPRLIPAWETSQGHKFPVAEKHVFLEKIMDKTVSTFVGDDSSTYGRKQRFASSNI